ncbi:hypothetical protein Q4491_04730 [Photobacterium sp. 2_MG-2023]|uniref:hypothetical protein n=2 Tax=unclassified Photobacterium TaxID=2628852 RepID=UPI0026E26FB6|nr:hypothetical protein [Photobacterium sp. 2_MG-2023]MDO6580644.1 hypothetical protein [Photobacterium sp. 2_MG-2023]
MLIKMKKLILSFIVMIALPFSVFAEQGDPEFNQPFTITQVFSEGTTTAGFYTAEALTGCKWNIMYLDLSTESGKAMFSQVLAAKSAGFKVVRVYYKKNDSETCMATGLHIR